MLNGCCGLQSGCHEPAGWSENTPVPHYPSRSGVRLEEPATQRSESFSMSRSFATARAQRPELGGRTGGGLRLTALTGTASRPEICDAIDLRFEARLSHSRSNRARCSAFLALSACSLSAVWRLRNRATAVSQALRAAAVRLGAGSSGGVTCGRLVVGSVAGGTGSANTGAGGRDGWDGLLFCAGTCVCDGTCVGSRLNARRVSRSPQPEHSSVWRS